jgi:diguanylate cyclase (GGDEF)-like protein/PAS domain S-box-containing protein
MVMGMAVTLIAATIGVLWGLIRKEKKKKSWLEYYAFGVITHIAMLFCVVFLPQAIVLETLKTIVLPVSTIYPLGTLAMCLIITYEQKNSQTEKLLRDSEIRFRTIFDQAPIGICAVNPDGGVYMNPAFVRIVGTPMAEELRQNPLSIAHPTASEEADELIRKIVSGEIVEFDMIKKLDKADDKPVWVHMYLSTLNMEKNSGAFLCMMQDITQEVEKENYVLESEKKHREVSGFLRTMIDSIPDHIFYKDTKGVYLGCNRAFEEASGISASRLIGHTDLELYDAETAKLFRDADDVVVRERKERRTEETIIYPDGRSIITETLKTPYYNARGEVIGLIGISRDITDRKKKEDEIQYLNIHDVMTGLYSRAYFDDEIYRIDEAEELPYSVILGDVNALKLTNDLFGHNEGDRLIIESARLLKLCCPTGIVARTGGDEFSVLLPQTGEEEVKEIVARINKAFHEYESLHEGRRYFMSISLGYATKRRPDEAVVRLLKTAEENMYRRKLLEHQSIRSTLLSTIKAMLFSKSNETMEHADRMVELARALGDEVGLSEADQVSLELMATLHDLGKIGISNTTLSKPGRLNETEWAEIKRHPETGYRIASTIPELQKISEYILCHHERWDGKGYPQGIAGEEIPFISRLISVIDAFDAMTQDRSYRKALSVEEAAGEIMKNAGTQFDPYVARVFIEKVLSLQCDQS